MRLYVSAGRRALQGGRPLAGPCTLACRPHHPLRPYRRARQENRAGGGWRRRAGAPQHTVQPAPQPSRRRSSRRSAATSRLTGAPGGLAACCDVTAAARGSRQRHARQRRVSCTQQAAPEQLVGNSDQSLSPALQCSCSSAQVSGVLDTAIVQTGNLCRQSHHHHSHVCKSITSKAWTARRLTNKPIAGFPRSRR